MDETPEREEIARRIRQALGMDETQPDPAPDQAPTQAGRREPARARRGRAAAPQDATSPAPESGTATAPPAPPPDPSPALSASESGRAGREAGAEPRPVVRGWRPPVAESAGDVEAVRTGGLPTRVLLPVLAVLVAVAAVVIYLVVTR